MFFILIFNSINYSFKLLIKYYFIPTKINNIINKIKYLINFIQKVNYNYKLKE